MQQAEYRAMEQAEQGAEHGAEQGAGQPYEKKRFGREVAEVQLRDNDGDDQNNHDLLKDEHTDDETPRRYRSRSPIPRSSEDTNSRSRARSRSPSRRQSFQDTLEWSSPGSSSDRISFSLSQHRQPGQQTPELAKDMGGYRNRSPLRTWNAKRTPASIQMTQNKRPRAGAPPSIQQTSFGKQEGPDNQIHPSRLPLHSQQEGGPAMPPGYTHQFRKEGKPEVHPSRLHRIQTPSKPKRSPPGQAASADREPDYSSGVVSAMLDIEMKNRPNTPLTVARSVQRLLHHNLMAKIMDANAAHEGRPWEVYLVRIINEKVEEEIAKQG